MENSLSIPNGWKLLDYTELSKDSGKPEKNLELIEPGPIGKGETDYHSKYVDPESTFGAAKASGGTPSSYEGLHDKAQNPEGEPGYDIGQLHIAPGEIVVEQGVQHRRPYYLVMNPEEETFYSVIPKVKSDAEEYRSPKKRTRSEALEATYKVLNVVLPESISDQMHYVYPESEVVVKSTASRQHM